MRELAGYSAGGTVMVGVAAAVLVAVLGPGAAGAVWVAAVAALAVQVTVFGALIAGRRRPNGFLAALTAGTLARFGTVFGLAAWAAWTGAVPTVPLLLSAAGFLFVLTLLEPVFYRPTAGVR